MKDICAIYQARKARIKSARRSNMMDGATDERLVVSNMRVMAATSIKEIDGAIIRCGAFDNLLRACLFISTKDDIKESKVYPALRLTGYDLIYNNWENADLLGELSDITNQSILSLDANMLNSCIFDWLESNTHSFTCRINRATRNEIFDRANKYGIKVSTLNMYHTMLGIRELVESDAKYTILKESDVGKDILSRLNQFEDAIKSKIFDIKHGIVPNDKHKEEMSSYNEKFIQMNVDMSSIGLEFVEYEYPMDIGRVDILCKSDDEFVLVEVKKGMVGTDVIGQVLKYVCTFDEPCKGMIIAEGFSKQVVNAANKLHIDLVKYTTWIDVDMRRHVEIHRL